MKRQPVVITCLGLALLCLLAGVWLAVFPARAGKAMSTTVSITTPDRVTLAGTFWAQSGHAPAVLLLHMLGRTRADWDGLAEDLAAQGFNVLTVDFRGHGESVQQGSRRLDYADFSERDWQGLTTDVAASLDWLARQPSVDAAHLAIVGASIGANSALIAASGDRRVTTLVLLSPGLDYHGLKTQRAMEQYGTRSVFLVASDDDENSAAAVRRLDNLASGRRALKVFQAAGHGTSMFGPEPTLKAQIVGWLKQNI